MFRQLGNCSPEFFVDNSEAVLKNEISLRELLKASEDSIKLSNCEKKILACVGTEKDMTSLHKKFPQKFAKEKLKDFTGAEPMGKKRNPQGKRLLNYLKSVQSGKTFDEPVKLEEFQHWSDIPADSH